MTCHTGQLVSRDWKVVARRTCPTRSLRSPHPSDPTTPLPATGIISCSISRRSAQAAGIWLQGQQRFSPFFYWGSMPWDEPSSQDVPDDLTDALGALRCRDAARPTLVPDVGHAVTTGATVSARESPHCPSGLGQPRPTGAGWTSGARPKDSPSSSTSHLP